MPAYSNDADFFPGMTQKWGLRFLINYGADTGRPYTRQPVLDRVEQQLRLDRPDQAGD